MKVLHDGVFGLDLSECALSAVELGLVWRLCPRLKRLDIGLRRGCRDTLHSAGGGVGDKCMYTYASKMLPIDWAVAAKLLPWHMHVCQGIA